MTKLRCEDNQEEVELNSSEAFPKTMVRSFDGRPGLEPVSDESDEEGTHRVHMLQKKYLRPDNVAQLLRGMLRWDGHGSYPPERPLPNYGP